MAALLRKNGSASGPDRRAVLGFDPTRDVNRVLLGAAGRGDGALDFVIAATGRFDPRSVVEAFARHMGKIIRERQAGQAVYRAASGQGPGLLFRGKDTVLLSSAGWLPRLLQRLQGRGQSISAQNPALGEQIRVRRSGQTGQAWVVSRLSSATARYLAGRVGWSELSRVAGIQGQISAGEVLRLEATLTVDSPDAARTLERRLRMRLQGLVAAGKGPLEAPAVRRDAREVNVALSLAPAQVAALLSPRGAPLD